jgi:hypothetical protein
MIALRTAGSVIGVDGPTLAVVAVLEVLGVLGAAGVLGAGVLAAVLLLLLELPHPAAATAATLKINATWVLPNLVIDHSNRLLRRRVVREAPALYFGLMFSSLTHCEL